jgi:hypothetical protein
MSGGGERFVIASWRGYPRYIALVGNDESGHHLYGYDRVHTYKSPRTARMFAGAYGPIDTTKIVFRLDLMCLPVVADDADVEGLKLSEVEFCERQMLLWGERAKAAERAAAQHADEPVGLTLDHAEQRKVDAAKRKERRRLRRLAMGGK